MLECAIPKCCNRERSLRSGTLHLADVLREDRSTIKRMIWLCDECTRRYTVQTWRPAGEQIRARAKAESGLAEVLCIRTPAVEPDLLRETA